MGAFALVVAQANRADAPVREALQQVADRINAIASASSTLAHASQGLEHVRIGGHLQQLCGQIEKGLFRPGVRLVCEFADVPVDAERTTSIAILVNELVTNALKHAFPDNREGIIEVSLKPVDNGLELVIADNGVGVAGSALTRGSGLGNRLIETFTRQLRGRHEMETGDGGTRHRIHIPLAA